MPALARPPPWWKCAGECCQQVAASGLQQVRESVFNFYHSSFMKEFQLSHPNLQDSASTLDVLLLDKAQDMNCCMPGGGGPAPADLQLQGSSFVYHSERYDDMAFGDSRKEEIAEVFKS